jgi:diguanylate cyclase (GGDEF)-like protein
VECKRTAARAAGREKLALLGRAELFSTLDEEEIAIIARYSGYHSFDAGQVIFSEGSQVEELYLIKSGTVVIRKKTEGGEDNDIARFLEGELFGEMDLLDTTPRDASAIAETPTNLLIFPRRGLLFPNILERHPNIFARILQKLLGVVAGRIRATDRLISEKTPWIQELKRQLLRDKLTSLHNKAYLEEELPRILAKIPQTSFLVVKPDNFKTINDVHGHDAGDKALVLIAETLKSGLKDADIAVRYRGDEFCIILNGRPCNEAVRIAADLLVVYKGIDVTPLIHGERLTLTASIGVSSFPDLARDAASLVSNAFEAMMEARNSGGDGFRVRGGA